jgi:hypothetical protein
MKMYFQSIKLKILILPLTIKMASSPSTSRVSTDNGPTYLSCFNDEISKVVLVNILTPLSAFLEKEHSTKVSVEELAAALNITPSVSSSKPVTNFASQIPSNIIPGIGNGPLKGNKKKADPIPGKMCSRQKRGGTKCDEKATTSLGPDKDGKTHYFCENCAKTGQFKKLKEDIENPTDDKGEVKKPKAKATKAKKPVSEQPPEEDEEMAVDAFDEEKGLLIAENIMVGLVFKQDDDGNVIALAMCSDRDTKEIRKFTPAETKLINSNGWVIDNSLLEEAEQSPKKIQKGKKKPSPPSDDEDEDDDDEVKVKPIVKMGSKLPKP